MTILATRPVIRVERPNLEPSRPIALGALIAAAWVALAGLVFALGLAVAAWFAADSGSFASAVRVGGLGWLIAHGAGVHAGGADVTAIPIGGALIAGLMLYRAGRWAGATSATRSAADAAIGCAVLTAAYAAAGLIVALLTHRSSGYVDLWRAAVAFTCIPAVFGGLGVVRGAGVHDALWRRVPRDVRCAVAGGVAGFLTLAGLSALAFAVSMSAHLSAALTVADGVGAGMVGGVILALVGLALVPNAVFCAGAFMAGPGFVVGAGTAVSSAGVHLGPLPAVPILAATPRSGGAWWQEAMVMAPLAAGAVAGLVAQRRAPTRAYPRLACLAAGAGALGGVTFGVACLLATGSVGPGRMAQIGPDVPRTMLVCGVAGLLAAAIAAVAVGWGAELLNAVRRGRASSAAIPDNE